MKEALQMTAQEVMHSRHAVRRYVPGVSIPQAELQEILELAATAPSSWNLQHWRFLVVTEQENKKRLLPIAFNQQQVVDCSAVIIILGDLEANKSAEAVYRPMLESGAMSQQAYDTLLGNIASAYAGGPEGPRDEANRNAALAAMQLMLAAKAKGYDTCPMGGFDRVKIREELNIPDRFLPVMMITLGKAAAPAHKTSRFPLEQLVVMERFS
ncbi:nitroreductase family protein [Brevibacillus massiliensis]|jgi:nitroreductase|uniref:nitroreductase family protein n=1 Tax=Brevibacillus massiliensis TaxID=1118054 RepID=UPI000319C619|nr:nitroreductase family protein [Brevibacillus massiliensis]